MQRLIKLNSLMNNRQRRLGGGLIVLTIISSLLDVLGVGSIMPFFAILANSDSTMANEFIVNLMAFLKIIDRQQLLIALGLGIFLLVMFSLTLKAILFVCIERYVTFFTHELSNKMLKKYLSQSYEWRLQRNSNELSKNILADVELIANWNIAPILSMISSAISTALIVGLLLYVDILLAVVTLCTLGSAFMIIYLVLHRLLSSLGERRVSANAMRFTVSAEAFQSPKEQKLYDLAPFFTNRYFKHSRIFADVEATVRAIVIIPRYAIEAVAFGGLLLILLYWLSKGEGFDEALPFLALYAFAGYRLMPMLQHLFNGTTQLKASEATLDIIYNDIKALDKLTLSNRPSDPLQKTVTFEHKIEMRDIAFSYQSASQTSLNGLNLTIESGTKVGIVGLSGSGKSTLLDVLTGLLDPACGQLRIDDAVLAADDVPSWQSNIGFVPQDVSLVDDTVGANIAVGVEPEHWDVTRMERAAEAANIHDFIVTKLARGYQTILGERGAKLSGGQRQRVAIARALYRQPKLLVLDEATSSLDTLTETKVMEAVYALDRSVTVVMISHRLTTVQNCDTIFVVSDGAVVAQGSYKELQDNEQFNKLANEAARRTP